MKILLVSDSPSLRHEIENLSKDVATLVEARGEDLLGEMKLEEFDVVLFERKEWQRHASIYRYYFGAQSFDKMSLVFLYRGKRQDPPKFRAGRKDVHGLLPMTQETFMRCLKESRDYREQMEQVARFAQA